MRTSIISIVAILTSISLFAQNNINQVLSSIEENNTTLKALRETAKADKLGNKVGLTLSNPEVGFNYLWGSPNDIGNRTDFSITQSFDISSISGIKNKVANEKNDLIEWQYKADRMNILLEAKQYCIELIYYNALKKELDLRLQHAKTIVSSYEKRMKQGDANVLEYNKAKLNLSTLEGEISKNEVERHALIEQLKRLNGGNEIAVEGFQFIPVELPVNFDDWYIEAQVKNPVLAYIKQEIEVSKRELSLSKTMGLPTLSAGYMSEKVLGERYQGISVGVSIPLWENKNRVKQAKAAVSAAESREIDSKQQFYDQLQILYNRTLGLKITAENYRKSMETANSTDLLKKALDAGEISLLEYILEIGLYYDTVNQALEAEKNYQRTYAELSAVEL